MPVIERSPLLRQASQVLVSESTPFQDGSCDNRYSPDDLKFRYKQEYASELCSPESASMSMGYGAEGVEGVDSTLFEALVELIIEKI